MVDWIRFEVLIFITAFAFISGKLVDIRAEAMNYISGNTVIYCQLSTMIIKSQLQRAFQIMLSKY